MKKVLIVLAVFSAGLFVTAALSANSCGVRTSGGACGIETDSKTCILEGEGNKCGELGNKLACPVMGNEFNPTTESAKSRYNNKTYILCCLGCKPQFDQNPGKYIKN